MVSQSAIVTTRNSPVTGPFPILNLSHVVEHEYTLRVANIPGRLTAYSSLWDVHLSFLTASFGIEQH